MTGLCKQNNLQTQSGDVHRYAEMPGRKAEETYEDCQLESKKKKKQAVGTLQVSNEASNRSARQEVVVEEIERMSSTSH